MLSRRELLRPIIAAPFIIGARKSKAAYFFKGSSPPANDLTETALAALPNNVWSADQIASGNHVSDLNFGGNLTVNKGVGNVFAFSGGCYASGQKKYMLPGTGGHSDSCNTGIATLDLTSLRWSVTEPSAQYNTAGSADPSNPCTTSEPTYKPWPNINGNRAPMSGHRYAIPIWMPEIGYGFSYGQWSYKTAGTNNGYGLFNAAGQYDQTKLFSNGPNGSFGSVPTALWVPGRKVIWMANSGDGYESAEFDPLVGTLKRPCNFEYKSPYAIPDLLLQGPPVLIPDPKNAGDQAVVFWANNYDYGSEAIFYCPKVGSGATGTVSSAIAFGGPVPAALSTGTANYDNHMSSWFDFGGNYKPGSTKILVWDWKGGSTAAASLTGLYLLDTLTWTWTGPLSGSAGPFASRWSAISNGGNNPGSAYGFRCVFVMTDYISVGNYVPIGLIQPDNSTSATCGQLYFYKIPWSAL